MENKKIEKTKGYREFIEGLNLQSIYLCKCYCEIDKNQLFIKSNEKEVKVDISDSAEFKKEDNDIEVVHEYKLDAKIEGQKKKFLKINCEYRIILASEEDFTEDFFQIYSNTSLPLNTWPYFREFVNSITSRMGIPPLTLPFFKH